MRCSMCGHESMPGASFCLNCGSALAPAAQTPAPPAGLPTICQVCRGENPPGMKFCRSCGASLAQAAMPGAVAPTPIPRANPLAAGSPMLAPLAAPGYAAPAAPAYAAPAPPAPPAFPPPSGPASFARPSGAQIEPLPPPPPAPQGSSINCPRCGTATPLGFAYCQQCGLHLQPIAPTDPGAASSRARQPSRPPPVAVQAGVDVQAATLAQPEAGRAALGLVTPAPASAPMPAPAPAAAAVAVPVARAAGAWGTAVLVNRDGSDGQRFPLTSEDTVIGRGGADIAFDEDRFLARQHARLERATDGNVRIHPIDGVNGVYKKADGAVELADGALILVGREVLRFEKVAPEERTVTPLVRHGVALFGSPPRDPWGRLHQLIPSGGCRDVRHLVGNEVVLGREEGDIVFRDDAFMSRRHAAVTWDGKRALLTDLGSSNGTFVRLTGPTPLKNGDHVRVGDQLLRIER